MVSGYHSVYKFRSADSSMHRRLSFNTWVCPTSANEATYTYLVEESCVVGASCMVGVSCMQAL